MLQIASLLFGFVTLTSAPLSTAHVIPLQEWVPQQNDRFIADTKANHGYIVHTDGSYTDFAIGSGKQQRVNYAGMTYNAATPEEKWTVESTTIQSDRAMFGKSGLFLRLSFNGSDEESHYGIHATGNIDDILASDDRYKSYGCVLVSDEVLEILAQTFALNNNHLDVVTVKGLPQISAKSGLAKSS